MGNKFKWLIIFILALMAFLGKVSLVEAIPCSWQCAGTGSGGWCDVCDKQGTDSTSDDECIECGDYGGEIEGMCAGVNFGCGAQECCNGGECGSCGAGAGNCPDGLYLQCGSVSAETCQNVNYKQTCFDRDAWNYGSACGVVGENCQANCSCCPAGTVRTTGSTYNTAAWSYPQGDPGNPATRWHCNSTNDDYLSSTDSSPWWNYNADPEGYYITRYNTCRTASCIVPAPITPSGSCNAQGTAAALSWDGFGEVFEVRLDDLVNGLTFGCGLPDRCIDIAGELSWSPSTTQGHTYAWEVRGKTSAGLTSEWVRGANFTCLAAAINGSCSTDHYNCYSPAASTYNISRDYTWTWTCPGSNGGYDAYCSENKTASSATASCDVLPYSLSNPLPYGGSPTIHLTSTNAIGCGVFHDYGFVEMGMFTSGYFPVGAQTIPGYHEGEVICMNSLGQFSALGTCPYTVNNAPINGSCGSANGGYFYSAPSTNLCNAGTPTVVSGSGPWTWSCIGVYGGTNASCGANILSEPWWQTQGGNIHADNGNISSTIPLSCFGSCLPYLITTGNGATGLASFTGTVDVAEGSLSQDGNNWEAKTEYKGLTTDFAYFRQRLSNDPDGIGDWDGSLPASDGVYETAGAMTTSGGNWTVGSGRMVILLADGNVTINNNIDVSSTAPGGFLAIIASGDIIISNSAVTNIEGVFVSDGVIRTSGTSQLTGEGIFTGWGGFSLGRDLADPADETQPAEKFIYRPDLQVNAYRYLLKQDMTWQEVNP